MVLYGTGPYGHTRTRFETADMTRQRLLTEGVAATARYIAATWFVAGKDAPAYETCVGIGSRAVCRARSPEPTHLPDGIHMPCSARWRCRH